MTETKRVQVTMDPELERALGELGDGKPRSRTIRDLAMRGAEALSAERELRGDAYVALDRIATGEDDGFDLSVSEALRLKRR